MSPRALNMESYLAEEALWATGLAARVRLVQANFADDQAVARQNYIAEEIERGLKGINPSKRPLYLKTLAEQFPAWQLSGSAAPPVRDLPPESPETLLRRLIESSAQLTPEAKLEFARELQKAGLVVKEPAGPAFELPAELQ